MLVRDESEGKERERREIKRERTHEYDAGLQEYVALPGGEVQRGEKKPHRFPGWPWWCSFFLPLWWPSRHTQQVIWPTAGYLADTSGVGPNHDSLSSEPPPFHQAVPWWGAPFCMLSQIFPLWSQLPPFPCASSCNRPKCASL